MDEEEKTQESEETKEPEQKQEGGKPDAEKAAEKYRRQRDDARKQLSEFQEKLKGYEGSDETIKDLKAQIEKMRADAEEAARKAEYERVNTKRLAEAGCVDTEVALELLDENGDVDALKESKPYLFAAPKGKTGLKPEGASKREVDQQRADALLGYRRPKN
jgi:hypothetical protein